MLDFKLSKMRKMITTGKNFWGVDVEFLQEDVKETTGVASYDPFFDRVEFHLKWIEKIAKEFPQIIDDEIDFAVLHELGHAKEARIYEEKGLFPYSRNILQIFLLVKYLRFSILLTLSLTVLRIIKWKRSFSRMVF